MQEQQPTREIQWEKKPTFKNKTLFCVEFT